MIAVAETVQVVPPAAKAATFEDVHAEAVMFIDKRRRDFDIAHVEWNDVRQQVLIRVWQQFPKFDASKGPFSHWVNRVVTNAIRNIWRDQYAKFARPCVTGKGGCDHNVGGTLCSNTPSGKQCSECPLYRKWEMKGFERYGVRFAVPLERETEDGEIERPEVSVKPRIPFMPDDGFDPAALRRAMFKLPAGDRNIVEEVMRHGNACAASRAKGLRKSALYPDVKRITGTLVTLYNLETGLISPPMPATNATEFSIDDDVPLPEPKRQPVRYPIDLLQTGQSFFVPGRSKKNFYSTMKLAARRTGHKFVARDMTDRGTAGVRVWRLS